MLAKVNFFRQTNFLKTQEHAFALGATVEVFQPIVACQTMCLTKLKFDVEARQPQNKFKHSKHGVDADEIQVQKEEKND